MPETTFAFQVDEKLRQAFDEAARAQGRTDAQLLRGFMLDFVQRQQTDADHDAWFRQQVQDGIAAADAGDTISSEEVERHFAARRANTRRKLVGDR